MNALTYFFHLDTEALIAINQGLANPVFDVVMPVLRNRFFWLWLYALVIFLAVINDRRWWIFILLALGTFALCDVSSASLIKPFVQRIRPCNDETVSSLIRHVVTCGSGYSFVSSHAANHFGLAMVFSHYLSRWYNPTKVKWLFFSWAALIAFSQVYVGVHYPLDVICGALLGVVIGIWVNRLANILLRSQSGVSA